MTVYFLLTEIVTGVLYCKGILREKWVFRGLADSPGVCSESWGLWSPRDASLACGPKTGPWLGASLEGVSGTQLSALRFHMGYSRAGGGVDGGAEVRVPAVERPDRERRLRMGGGVRLFPQTS